jgi:hypothetical protein
MKDFRAVFLIIIRVSLSMPFNFRSRRSLRFIIVRLNSADGMIRLAVYFLVVIAKA